MIISDRWFYWFYFYGFYGFYYVFRGKWFEVSRWGIVIYVYFVIIIIIEEIIKIVIVELLSVDCSNGDEGKYSDGGKGMYLKGIILLW